ncbi:hypothetical protein [Aestuariivirga sp.]|uniref:hypothetical protein n=1 Tax=Aestuariivirga sp. TaxID=2650926 RepID=UPI003BAD9BDA
MNRRKPRVQVAVVPREEGQDHAGAVLRKAARTALSTLDAQWKGGGDSAYLSFIAGYLAGLARHQALKHGVDAEDTPLEELLQELRDLSPKLLHAALSELRFSPRHGSAPARAKLAAQDAFADAGYLVGHLESLCGTQRLLPASSDAAAYLTRCDTAADRMQTHHPTASLRFDAGEREIVSKAVAALNRR